jgi:hypothetical protein
MRNSIAFSKYSLASGWDEALAPVLTLAESMTGPEGLVLLEIKVMMRTNASRAAPPPKNQGKILGLTVDWGAWPPAAWGDTAASKADRTWPASLYLLPKFFSKQPWMIERSRSET